MGIKHNKRTEEQKNLKRHLRDCFGIVKHFLPTNIISIASSYIFYTLNENDLKNCNKYYDPLMESIARHYTSTLGKFFHMPNLIPTHTYFRIYKNGDEIKENLQTNPGCEIMAIIPIKTSFRGVYPLNVFDKNNTECVYEPDIGDAIVFKGYENRYYRRPFFANENDYYIELVLNFVDGDGPHGKNYIKK